MSIRLWFVFLGLGMVTIVALAPGMAVLTAGQQNTSPVSIVALFAMLAGVLLDLVWSARVRKAKDTTPGVSGRRRPGPTAFLALHAGLILGLQSVVITRLADSPEIAQWAFLAMALVAELMVLTVAQVAWHTFRDDPVVRVVRYRED